MLATRLGLGRALSTKAAAKAAVPRPPVVAKGDTRFVLERRAWLGEVSRLRKAYMGEQQQKAAAARGKREAALQRVAQQREEARGLKQSRAAEIEQRVAEEKRAAELALEESHRASSRRALEIAAEHRARMAARVSALKAESASWMGTEAIEEALGAELFTSVRSPVNDTPAFSRSAAQPDDARRSGVAPDHELLSELAKEGSVDLPIWLRHTLVGPSRGGPAP